MRAWRRSSCAVSMAMFSALHRTRAFVPSCNVRFGAASLLSRSSNNVVVTPSAAVHCYPHSSTLLGWGRRHSRGSGRAAVLSMMVSVRSNGGVQEAMEIGVADGAIEEHRWSSRKVRVRSVSTCTRDGSRQSFWVLEVVSDQKMNRTMMSSATVVVRRIMPTLCLRCMCTLYLLSVLGWPSEQQRLPISTIMS